MHDVLFIGPYNNRSGKGGVNSVLKVYRSEFEGFRCISTFPFENRFLNYFVFPILLLWICAFVVVTKRRIVHLHGASNGSFIRKYLIYKFIKRFTKKVVIYHIHGANFDSFYRNASKTIKARIREMLQNVDVVVCLSEFWKRFFEDEVGVKRVIIINNIVNDNSRTSDVIRNKTPIVKFLFLGRIGKRKGLFDLLDVVNDHRVFLNSKFKLFVGGDGEVQQLLDYIHSNFLEDLVEYVGWVDGPMKNDLLSSCDVFILPSYSEGLPISILEAMSYGLPIVSTTVGGIPELVRGNGYLITPGDKSQLFLCIKKMLELDRSIFSRLSKQLVQSFYPGAVLSQLTTLYNTLR